MVVEGMYTTQAAYELAKKHGIEMPITEMIYKLINGQIGPNAAVDELMGRDLKHERG